MNGKQTLMVRLQRYSGGAPTKRVADRICSAPIFPRDPDLARVVASKLRRLRGKKATSAGGLMTYQDFVWFILSEEDKDSVTALEYWFRIIDIDEDGFWSSYELECIYPFVYLSIALYFVTSG